MFFWTLIQFITIVSVVLVLLFPVTLLFTHLEKELIRKPDIRAYTPIKIKWLSGWLSSFHMADIYPGQLIAENSSNPFKDWWFSFRTRYTLSMYAFFGFFTPAPDWRDSKYQNMTNVITGLDPYWVISKITGSAYAQINKEGPGTKDYWRYNTFIQVNVIASILGMIICFGPVAFVTISLLNMVVVSGAYLMRVILTPLRTEIIDRVFTDIRVGTAEEVIDVIGKKAIGTPGMESIYAVAFQTTDEKPAIIYATNQLARHYHLFPVLHDYFAQNGVEDPAIPEVIQGFITNEGRFVERGEAMRIAMKTNAQLDPKDQQTAKDMIEKGLTPDLFSENIQ